MTTAGPRIYLAASRPDVGAELWSGWTAIVTGQPRRALSDLRRELASRGLPPRLRKRLSDRLDAADASLAPGGDGARRSASRYLQHFIRALRPESRAIPDPDIGDLSDLATQLDALLAHP